ncbi:heterokaryon incompatibility protein-domain-containing protein [Xylaria curta]|nr:heterokaryon incompatibility protein-domain-containing protein [Xylaria curta]
MQEIHDNELSATFKDAIWMTRRFGIDYILIDSLCIVQDDAADWELESAQMASIYYNAYLTIAATKSSSGAGGLFSRTPDFKVSGTTPAGEDYYLVFREKIDHEPPLNTNTASRFPLYH